MPKIKMLADWKNRKIGDEWNANEATAKQLIEAGKAEAIQVFSLPKPTEVSEGSTIPKAEPSAAETSDSVEPIASSEPVQDVKPAEAELPPPRPEAPEPLTAIGQEPLAAEGGRTSESTDDSEKLSDLEETEPAEAFDSEEVPSRYNRRRARG